MSEVARKLRACGSGPSDVRALGFQPENNEHGICGCNELIRTVFGVKQRAAYVALNAIADAIDAEEAEMRDFCEKLNELADEREEVDLFGHAYVPLPLDANGVPIRVGDWIAGRLDVGAKVEAVTSDDVYWFEPDGCHWCHASEVRHYHKPTVEDLLREMAVDWDCAADGEDKEAVLKEYAAKLRLADDGDVE